MANKDAREWVNLSEAARTLGVHPSTVRTWADRGDLASQRTRGGHRRFRRVDLEEWAANHRQGSPPAIALVVQSAMGRARMEMTDGQLSQLDWYAKMPEAAREEHRRMGRRLLALLSKYLTSETAAEHDALLPEVRLLGLDYYRLGVAGQLSLTENVRAFLRFHDFLTESVMQMADAAGPANAESVAGLYRLTARFTNEVLVALITAHETGV